MDGILSANIFGIIVINHFTKMNEAVIDFQPHANALSTHTCEQTNYIHTAVMIVAAILADTNTAAS